MEGNTWKEIITVLEANECCSRMTTHHLVWPTHRHRLAAMHQPLAGPARGQRGSPMALPRRTEQIESQRV